MSYEQSLSKRGVDCSNAITSLVLWLCGTGEACRARQCRIGSCGPGFRPGGAWAGAPGEARYAAANCGAS
jgi:hypothetical protein